MSYFFQLLIKAQKAVIQSNCSMVLQPVLETNYGIPGLYG